MLYSIENEDDLASLEELASLQSQSEELRLQDKLCKQNFHANIKKVFETVFDTLKNTSGNLKKILTECSSKDNQALENLNEKILE